MTINVWLGRSQGQLKEAGIATARLDCLVLLEDATRKERGWLLAHPEYELPTEQVKKLHIQIHQRAQHNPLAYIRGKSEFYGREFVVNEHTLVPRPETETMIDMLKRMRNMEADVAVWEGSRRKKQSKQRHYAFEKPEPNSSLVKTAEGFKVLWQKSTRKQIPTEKSKRSLLAYHDEDFHFIDVGTGSGAIAITTKLELPDVTVTAIDIDKKCLEIAGQNAKKLGADITMLRGNLLQPLDTQEITPDKQIVLLCNLPYVPNDFPINTAATHEPRHALFGGDDGLDLYREMFEQIKTSSWKPVYILTESLPSQHIELTTVAKAFSYSLERTDDFIQLFSYAD